MAGSDKNVALPINSPLIDAIKLLERNKKSVVVVLDLNSKVVGTISDGDIRRAFLQGVQLNANVDIVMNPKPITALSNEKKAIVASKMVSANVLAVPVVDAEGKFIELLTAAECQIHQSLKSNEGLLVDSAVIMAGGKGTRLRPYTESIPKPMIDVGEMPLLERQILQLKRIGITKFFLSVNYLSEVIEDYFQNGSDHGVEIKYIRENAEMGSGGGLRLFPYVPTKPVLVLNGDVLTGMNFGEFLQFHVNGGQSLTIAGVLHQISVPFGVLKTRNSDLVEIQEKPAIDFLCNGGIYIVSAELIDWASNGSGPMTMVELIDFSIRRKKKTKVFPVHEFWNDIGTPGDLETARTFVNKK